MIYGLSVEQVKHFSFPQRDVKYNDIRSKLRLYQAKYRTIKQVLR
jgi:hypothetical protein